MLESCINTLFMSSEATIIDSQMTSEEALVPNPENPAPQEILDMMEVLSVRHYGFDGLIHSGQIVMNKDVIEDIKKFFDLALELKFPIKNVIPINDKRYLWDDNQSCEDNNSSGFNYRLVAGTNRLSKHSNGRAFDINPVQNIYVRYENGKEVFRAPTDGLYDKNAPGTLTSNYSLVILIKNLGWEWGGDWTPETGREDYQHFEKF